MSDAEREGGEGFRLSSWRYFSNHFNSVVFETQTPLNLKVQIYTVTKSGIVSAQRFEEMHRMSAPSVNVTTEEIAKTTAVFRIALDTVDNVDLDECSISLIVLDMHGTSIYEGTVRLSKQPARVPLHGLRPYHKYAINAQVSPYTRRQIVKWHLL